MKLRIAETLSLPIDAVTQTLAAIGRKGAGKTYLSQMLCEQMLDAGAQCVSMDAVGNWWGLRVGADGKSKGKDIFVIGGDHGDVPLVASAGAQIARLLVEKRISAVLDVSGFRIGERKRFATDFAEEFFHLKKSQRSPVHVFVEEAQLFIPQRIDRDEARMYGAFEAIVRIGRNYGIGCTLISQRPQSVNKEVLSQVECLCVLQVNGTHERKALEEWVQEAGADRKLVGELPGLSRGEGYVWSPSWLRVFERVHFAKKTTFDASATPEVGKSAARAAKLSDIDVEALRESIAEVIEEAEKDDPKALRRQIADLTKQLREKESKVERPEPEVVKVAVVDAEVIESFEHVCTVANGVIRKMELEFGEMKTKIDQAIAETRRHHNPVTRPKGVIPKSTTSPESFGRLFEAAKVKIDSNGKLRAGAERMLAALCQWYPEWMSQGQMRSHAGLKKSGTFDTYMSDLRRGGYIEENGKELRSTQVGIDYFGGKIPDAPSTTEEVLAVWEPKLRLGARRILRELISCGGSLSRPELAEAAGMAVSGTFDTYLSDLRRARLIETGSGVVTANKQTLFL